MGEADNALERPSVQGGGVVEGVYAPSLGMRIAVLGPGLGSPSDLGFQKRKQIRDELTADGHRPFFPEEEGLLAPDNPFDPLLEQERRLLSGSDVQLIIVLCTPTSIGVGFEIAYFMGVPEIKAKTAVLYPSQHYTPNDNLAANTVRAFSVRLPYTEEHFKVCQLVEECRKWARDRETGSWAGIAPFEL